MPIVRFGVSIASSLLRSFDQFMEGKGYSNRSEALRDLIREKLVKEEWQGGSKEVCGTISIVYDHHGRELPSLLTEMQHRQRKSIISTTHIHLDDHNCLEVLIVRGKSNELKRMGDRLIGTKGVKHGTISLTTTGKDLS